MAPQNEIRKIAFPSISTGVYGYPVDKAAKIVVEIVNRFIMENQYSFDVVEWVLFDDRNFEAYDAEIDYISNEEDLVMGEIINVPNEDFDPILQMIYSAKQKAEYQVNTTIIDLYWEIGQYVCNKANDEGWGRSTVKELSSYILSKEPGIRGYSPQNIWRMKQFYETYRDYEKLSTLLRENTWSNNLHIMSKTKSYEEKEFYLKLARKEHYSARELERQIDSGYYERLVLSSGKAPSEIETKEMSGVIRDMYMLEFLELPEPYKEKDPKKSILKNFKKFLIEFGKDFLFMGEEYHLQVGTKDYFVDLLFYHRELQCLVAIDLKIDDFKPEYLGKMEFYLEALDRDEKKSHENPSVGIILCKSADSDVVEYALNRNMTSTMVAEYRTKLIDKEVLRKKLDQIFEEAEENNDVLSEDE